MTELMQRRRALMGAHMGKSPQLIPDQTHTFTTRRTIATITEGHHIKLDFALGESDYGFINISDMSKNGSEIAKDGANVNDIADTLVSFPAGSSVTLTVSNFTKTPNEVLSRTNGNLTVGFRKKSARVTAMSGVGYLSTSNVVRTNTVSFASATDASCLFVYLDKIKANVSIEFDIGLAINGQKVI